MISKSKLLYHIRKAIGFEREIAVANGVLQAIKESFDEEKQLYLKEIEDEKTKAQIEEINYKSKIENLKNQIETIDQIGGLSEIMTESALELSENSSSNDLLKIIIRELNLNKKEEDCLSLKMKWNKKLNQAEIEYQRKIVNMKKESKRTFNLDMKNVKTSYENQLKQARNLIRKKDKDSELLKIELMKKDSEIKFLKEDNTRHENEKKMYSEQVEILSKVCISK